MPFPSVVDAPGLQITTSRVRHSPSAGSNPLALVLPAFLLTRAVIFFAATTATDSQVYYQYGVAARVASVDSLYRSYDAEYPQLAVVFAASVGWFADALPTGAERLIGARPGVPTNPGLARFQVALGLVLFSIDAGLFLLVLHRAKQLDPGDPRTQTWRLGIYVAGTAALGPILYDRLDLLVGAIAAVALLAFSTGRSKLAYVLLTVGVGIKLVTAVLLPVFVLATAVRRGGRFWPTAIRETAIALAIFAAWPVLAFAFGGGERAFVYLNYHSARGVELGSAYAAPLLFIAPDMDVGYAFGGYVVRGSTADAVARFSVAITLVVVGLAIVMAVRGASRAAPADRVSEVASGCVLVWLAFILTNKVGSPQYLLWVAPLVPFLPMRSRSERAWALGFVAASLLATLTYPYLWPSVHGLPIPDTEETWAGPTTLGFALLFARWGAIAILTGWLFVRALRTPAGVPA